MVWIGGDSMPSYKDELYGAYYDQQLLAHNGILGQHWGIRRFQNEDGTRTAAGKKRDAKAEYKQAKKSIKDTRNKLLEKDDDRISDDFMYGKTGVQEARRRGANAETLRNEQARAMRLSAKSEMNAKLAENSRGLSKKIRQAKSEHEAKLAAKWEKEAGKTKKMINVTNDVYKKRLGSGEKIATELLMSNSGRNLYYSNRANMSASQALGRSIAQSMFNTAVSASVNYSTSS